MRASCLLDTNTAHPWIFQCVFPINMGIMLCCYRMSPKPQALHLHNLPSKAQISPESLQWERPIMSNDPQGPIPCGIKLSWNFVTLYFLTLSFTWIILMLSDNKLFCRMILVWIWLDWAVAAGQPQHRTNEGWTNEGRTNEGCVSLVHPVNVTSHSQFHYRHLCHCYENLSLELEEWLISEERLLFLQKTWVQLIVHTRLLTAVWNSSSRG